jgi:hypothetical protein
MAQSFEQAQEVGLTPLPRTAVISLEAYVEERVL